MAAVQALKCPQEPTAQVPEPIVCDQALFTSVRTPMGEGYRIIAASPGLKTDEKQAITRNAPSHGALVDACEDAEGVAFYQMPSGRLCAAYSCYAGAEHTGRGGQRVYTVSVVFDRDQFPKTGYNPFNVIRAMCELGLGKPQLSPPPKLEPVELTIKEPLRCPAALNQNDLPTGPARSYLLSQLLSKGNLILDLEEGFAPVAEALLLGLPGPVRADVSFAAGLRFSVGRTYRLYVLHNEKKVTKSRIAGQHIVYLDREAAPPTEPPKTHWFSLVDKYWQSGKTEALTRKTSRPFEDLSPAGLERIASLYLATEEAAMASIPRLVAIASQYLGSKPDGYEATLVENLMAETQAGLIKRLGKAGVVTAANEWPAIVELWRRGEAGVTFIQPAVDVMLPIITGARPIEAARLALEVANPLSDQAQQEAHSHTLDQVLEKLARYVQRAGENEREEAAAVAQKWQAIRPQCPIVAKIIQQCSEPVDAASAPPPDQP